MLTQKEKQAVKAIISVAKCPEIYGIISKNTASQNEAIIVAMETLFEIDENGNVIDFNEYIIDTFSKMNPVPSQNIF